MLLAAFVAAAAVTLSSPAPARPSRGALRPAAHVAPLRDRSTRPNARTLSLYSAHARAEIAAYLRLRLLELREEGLERAVRVIERRLPVDVLLDPH